MDLLDYITLFFILLNLSNSVIISRITQALV